MAEGRPSELDILTLEDELGRGAVKGAHGELDLPFREPSYFSIGDPVVWPVSDLAYPELQLQAHAYEFHQVQLTCSFQAASGCRLSEARFTVDLTARGPAGAGLPAEDAIAYDMFPALLEDATTVKVTSTLKADVVLKFEPVTATLSLPTRERVEEEVRYCSRVVAFDLRGSHPAWSFHRTAQHEIAGPQRLFLLVRKPRGTGVDATFSLRARVEFVVGGQGFAPVDLVMLFRRRSRSGELTDRPAVPLC